MVKDGGKEVIQVRVKWPKENKTGGEFVVEVFESANDHCPVKALKKWWGRNPPDRKVCQHSEGGTAWP